MPSPPVWHVQLFGVLQLTTGSEHRVTRFRTQMTGSLFAYLAYYDGRPQPREVLIDQFWPDADPKAGRGRLSVALSSLRTQLSPTGSGVELLLADSFTVALNPLLFETDVTAFKNALKRASFASGPSERVTLLTKAVNGYTADFLVGRYEPWVLPEQERLRDQFLQAVATLIRLREGAGDAESVLPIARRATQIAPLREEAWCDLIRLLFAVGETGEALQVAGKLPLEFERAGLRVSDTAVSLIRRLQQSARTAGEIPLSAPFGLANVGATPPDESLPALPASGTFTVLMAEGDEAPLSALAAAAREQGGIILSRSDGETCFAFGNGYAAVAGAVVGMRNASGKLRAALDTGFLEITGGKGEGAPLRILPQLVGAAHEGQVLCTEVTAALAWHRVDEKADAAGGGSRGESDTHRLRDLGWFRLADDGIPHRLFQAEATDAPPPLFPPPRVAQGYTTGTLPPAYTRFFGRENELARLAPLLTAPLATASLANTSLITLTGIGGIGKTRLAVEAATQVQKHFDGRVWFAALAELHDARYIPGVLRDALRLPKQPSTDTMEQIAEFLGVAPSLLVIDNMEQFAASGEAAAFLRNLRMRVPSLVCLVTSRQMIGVEGERAFPVGPLSLISHTSIGAASLPADMEDGISLFVDRARAVRPDFGVTAANFGPLQRLCAMLEGIPLAIELAAARSGLLSPAQMLAQMEGRFALLQSRRRDLPERHRSLWAAVDSSFRLLQPETQRFFARLSGFRGGWTLQAAKEICGVAAVSDLPSGITSQGSATLGDAATLEAIAELQECSLIAPMGSGGSEPRFQMLDTLREFAAEQLREQGDEIATRQRHQRFYTRLIAEAEPHLTSGGTTADQQEWLDKLQADHENLRAALLFPAPPLQSLHTAIALHRFWLMRDYAVEGRDRLASALKAVEDVPPADHAKAQNALGVLAWSVGSLEAAQAHLLQALHLYRVCAEPDNVARALNNIGIVSSQNGNFNEARASYEESLRIYRSLGDTLHQSIVMTNLGGVLIYLEDYDAARRVLEESLPIQKAAHDDFSLHRTLQNLAEVAIRQKDTEAAAAAMHESLLLRRTLGDHNSAWDMLATTAVILGERNQFVEAAVLWGAVQALLEFNSIVLVPANIEVATVWKQQLQQRLPSEVFDTAQQKGRAMDFDQSLAFAEQQLRAAVPEKV